eukprot:3141756-Amphidinium_carterae.1
MDSNSEPAIWELQMEVTKQLPHVNINKHHTVHIQAWVQSNSKILILQGIQHRQLKHQLTQLTTQPHVTIEHEAIPEERTHSRNKKQSRLDIAMGEHMT